MMSQNYIFLVAIFTFMNLTISSYYNDTWTDCTDNNKIKSTDHVLFEYEIFNQDGELLYELKKPKQLAYVNLGDEVSGGLDLAGLCKSNYSLSGALVSGRRFIFSNADIKKVKSIVTLNNNLGKEIFHEDAKNSFIMNVIPSNVTSAEDYQIFTTLDNKDTDVNTLQLIRGNIGINAVDKWSQTPLMIAAIKRQTAVFIELLNSRKVQLDVNAAKPSGFSAIFYVIEHFPVQMLGFLIAKGANVNAKTKEGAVRWMSPLHLACMLDKYEHAALLLKNNADMMAINELQKTPIDLLPNDIDYTRRNNYKTLFESYKTNRLSSGYDDESERDDL